MVEIHLALNPCESKVIVDGIEITDKLFGIKVEQTVSTIPIVELQLKPDQIKITGDIPCIRDKGINEYTQEELLRELVKRGITQNKYIPIGMSNGPQLNNICQPVDIKPCPTFNPNITIQCDANIDKIAEGLAKKLKRAAVGI